MLYITGTPWLDGLMVFIGVASTIGIIANIRDLIEINKRKKQPVPAPQPALDPQPQPEVEHKCKPEFLEYGDLTGRVSFQVQVSCSIRLGPDNNVMYQHLPVLLGHGEDYEAMLDQAKAVTAKWIDDNGVQFNPKG